MMELNKLLARQLQKLNINPDNPYVTPEQLVSFIDRVNKVYTDIDDERYLLERSLVLSSQELNELNERLETGQHIAKLGYWELDLKHEKVFWSKELYLLQGLTPGSTIPNYQEALKRIHPEDRARVKSLLEKAIQENKNYEYELRTKHADGEYRWLHVTCQRTLRNDFPILRGTALDITDRKKDEQELTALQQQLIVSARMAGMAHMAGMADLAASTLHNVGNILNSANVSVQLLRELVAQSDFKKFEKIMTLLEKNKANLGEYLYQDPQGKLIPEYLIILFQNVKKKYDAIVQEIENTSKNISHINDILITQNEMSQPAGITENVLLSQVIEEALRMSSTAFIQYDIRLEKKYQDISPVLIDKIKLLQILINLIKNATEAVNENSDIDKKIISIFLKENKAKKMITITVKDNGIGILEENLPKLFSMGFTTKTKGHGLGLHMCALHAKDFGGSLIAQSEGIGKGATFTLTFPKIEAYQSSLIQGP